MFNNENFKSVRGVRSSHMYYKAGERESPESWTGNWRIESLKVGNKKTVKP